MIIYMQHTLSSTTKEKSAQQLGVLLANLHILYMTVRNVHWNLRHSAFIALHTFMEETYNDLAESIDETAEHIRSLGFDAPASLSDYVGKTTLTDVVSALTEPEEALRVLVEQYDAILSCLHEYMHNSESDMIREDFYVGLAASLEKTRWIIHSHRPTEK